MPSTATATSSSSPRWDSWIDSGPAGLDPCPSRRSSLLLAERNPEMRALLAFVLRRDGHEVVAVADGGELLEALAARSLAEPPDPRFREFDAILSAQDIRGIPGLAVLAGLRARGRTTPFVLMTPDPHVQAHARRLGAVILDQPLSVRTIRSSLQEAASLAASARAKMIASVSVGTRVTMDRDGSEIRVPVASVAAS
jgi:CheY-like chemotaxis protein